MWPWIQRLCQPCCEHQHQMVELCVCVYSIYIYIHILNYNIWVLQSFLKLEDIYSELLCNQQSARGVSLNALRTAKFCQRLSVVTARATASDLPNRWKRFECRWPTVPIWPPFLFYFSFITHPSQVNKSKKELWSAYSSSPGKQLCGFGCRKTPTALSFPFPSLPGSWGRSCLQPKDLRVVLLPTANPLTSDWKMSLWNMVICSHLKKFHPSIEKAIGAIPLVWPQRHCKLLLGTAISPWHQRVISSYSSFLYPLRLPRRQPMPLEPSSFGKRMLSPGVGTKSASMIRWSPVLRASLTVDP